MDTRFSIRGSTLCGILFLVVAAALAAALVFTAAPSVQAARAAPLGDDPVEDPLVPDAWMSRSCTIDSIHATGHSLMLRCTTDSPTNVYAYALPVDAANRDYANRALVLMNTAYALGENLRIYYENDSTLNPPSCTINCRGLMWVEIGY